ncbi:MAG: 4-hydroxy-tetrahydrodipicolinate reductase [Prevotellaceae bacterium]|nr:4-hydroxy-tetrahydrodipicolinate reductase [Candidatus Colivivens equi]
MKIALIGYGKMGKMIEQVAIQRGHEIVCIIDVDNQQDYDSDKFRSADVAIEFTAPAVAFSNYQRAWEQGVKVVSGSTGWCEQHGDEVRRACTEGGKTLFWASNFSVGVAIFSAVNRYLAKIMNGFKDYDVSITETHHIHKLDAPSGTAITLANEIISGLDRKTSWQLNNENDNTTCSFDKQILPITSIREGEIAGIHSVDYNSEADRITITHDAHSRVGFALGAVLAAEYTLTHSGLLTTSDLFKF